MENQQQADLVHNVLDDVCFSLRVSSLLTPQLASHPHLSSLVGEALAQEIHDYCLSEAHYQSVCDRVGNSSSSNSSHRRHHSRAASVSISAATSPSSSHSHSRNLKTNIVFAANEIKKQFRSIERQCRSDPHLMGKLQDIADPQVADTLWFRSMSDVSEFCKMTQDKLNTMTSTQKITDADRETQELTALRDVEKTEDEALTLQLQQQKSERSKQQTDHRAQIASLTSDISKFKSLMNVNQERLAMLSKQEMERVEKHHQINMAALNDEIQRLLAHFDKATQLNTVTEDTLRKKLKTTEKQIEMKIKSYDEDMISLTKRFESLTVLFTDEKQRFDQVKEKVDKMTEERVYYEEHVEKAREHEKQKRLEVLTASNLIQRVYRLWIAQKRQREGKAAKAASPKKKK